jgi:hypothetical protein
MLLSASVMGSHLNGGEVTYNCLGGNTYEVTLTLYWECSAVNLPDTQLINYSSTTLGQSIDRYAKLTNSLEITNTCSIVQTACTNPGSPYPGNNMYTFKDTIQLTGNANDWIVQYNSCCRIGSISNMNNPSSQNVHLNTVIDNSILCNSSPYFLYNPDIMHCRVVQNCINFQANDPDGDSLVYKVVPALTAYNTATSYSPGHSTSSPVEPNNPTNFSIDQQTGQVCFTTNNLSIPNLTVEVEEYRNGVLIGAIRRDMVYFITNCANSEPILSGIDNTLGTNYDTTVCANQSINLTISAFDADVADNVSVNWDTAITGATFSINNSTGSASISLSFISPDKDTTLTFTVMVNDSVCPYIGDDIQTYTIKVNKPVADAGGTQNNICSGGSTVLGGFPSAAGGTAPYQYQWTPQIGLNNPSSPNPITILCDTLYVLEITDNYACSATDTVHIQCNNSVQANAGVDDTVCVGGTFILGGNPVGVAPFTFNWSPGVLVNDSTVQNPFGFTCDTIYIVEVTDANGCIDLDSVYIKCHTLPVTDAGPDTCIGIGTCVQIGSSALPNLQYTWTTSLYLNDSSLSNPIACPTDTITYELIVQDTIQGCLDVDSVTICVVPADSVWPGDANADGIANVLDILNIGLTYNFNGPVRLNATNNWVAQAAGNWTNSFANGLNHKHADCNGDGVVDFQDVLVLIQNYNLTHNKTDEISGANEPELFFDWIVTDTLGENQVINIPIHLGTSALVADSMYGLAFSIHYNNTLIDTSNISLTFTNSWLGSSNLITVDTNFSSIGQIDIGISRTDQQFISGNGEICNLEIVTADDLTGMTGNTFDTLDLSFTVHGANNHLGNAVNIIPIEKELIILSDYSQLGQNSQVEKFKISPNPSQGSFRISNTLELDEINIINQLGQTVHKLTGNQIQPELDIDLINGIYFVCIESNGERYVQKLEIIK